jgi:hypothetical protein
MRALCRLGQPDHYSENARYISTYANELSLGKDNIFSKFCSKSFSEGIHWNILDDFGINNEVTVAVA